MSEMVARVAQVLCEARRGEKCQRRAFDMTDEDCRACDYAIQNHTQSIWVIKELREPTEAMRDIVLSNDEFYDPGMKVKVWRKMIDAALEKS